MMDDSEYLLAHNTLLSLLEDEPDFAKAHNLLGWLYMYHLNNELLAEKHFEWSVRFDPEYKPAYLHLVELYLRNENYQALEKLIEKATHVKGLSRAYLYLHKGLIEEMKLNFSTAIKNYKTALFHSMDTYEIDEIKNHLKRCRIKRFKKLWSYGYYKNNG